MIKRLPMLVAALMVALFSPAVSAVELGLTPSHVYRLWTNINAGVLRVAKVYSAGETQMHELQSMSARRFDDKTPRDVLDQVVEFRKKLDRLAGSRGLTPATMLAVADGEKVTPSNVFLNSGFVLDDLVLLIVDLTPADELVSAYFEGRAFSGKSPSDVYGMVDLANRRLVEILRNAGV